MKQTKVLLIYPPPQLMPLEAPRPDGSLGPLYLSSALQREGVTAYILDASVGPSGSGPKKTFYTNVMQENGLTRIGMSFEEIAEHVLRGDYDFVGISSNFTPQTRMAFETARAIKKVLPDIPIFAGGVNARALYERFLRTGLFDAVCLSEGEKIFPRMVSSLTPEELAAVPGIAFRHGEQIRMNPVNNTCFPKHLDELAMPAWEKLPFDLYDSINSTHGTDVGQQNSRYAPIMTSRGCIFNCRYCHISSEGRDSKGGNIGHLRTHSLERVIEEVERLKSLGVGRLFFEDDTLFARKDRARRIFSEVSRYGITIANVNGVNLINLFTKDDSNQWKIDLGFIDLLKSAGFTQLVFPAESGSQRILDKYASGKVVLDKMDLTGLMETLIQRGINAPVNLMIGFPDETEEEILKTVELGRRLKDAGAPYVSFFIPIPFPGSALYNLAIAGGYLQEDFDTDIMNWKVPVMINTTVRPERLTEIRDRANDSINDPNFRARAFKKTIAHRWASGD